LAQLFWSAAGLASYAFLASRENARPAGFEEEKTRR
jgi:hypothetical protein